jgi:hypothetical protein
MPYKKDRTVMLPVAKVVQAVDQLFATELKAGLGSVPVPSRVVIIYHDP